jgi:A/G-specific adenine glycosylase
VASGREGRFTHIRRALLSWWRDNGRALPWRGERDPFRVLLAEVLLQKTPWWKVTRVYSAVLDRWPTADALAAADVGELADVLRPLGIVSRAPRVRELAAAVSQRGCVPTGLAELLDLPGVGDYVARAVRCFAFGKPEALVDSVSGRLLRRVFGLPDVGEPGRDPRLQRLAASLVGKARPREVSWAVLDLASAVCKPKRPRCWECPLVQHCSWARRGRSGGQE